MLMSTFYQDPPSKYTKIMSPWQQAAWSSVTYVPANEGTRRQAVPVFKALGPWAGHRVVTVQQQLCNLHSASSICP